MVRETSPLEGAGKGKGCSKGNSRESWHWAFRLDYRANQDRQDLQGLQDLRGGHQEGRQEYHQGSQDKAMVFPMK